jgi:microcystin-dependent protein
VSEPFIGEIKMVGFNFAPRGYAQCNGQILSIAQNTALFSLLGTTYGGNGQTTFALPDLRSRIPVHVGQGPGLSDYSLGQASGTETVTLSAGQLAPHGHTVNASTTATSKNPANNVPAVTGAGSSYAATPTPGTTMNAGMVTGGGSGQPHNNLQPYLCVNFVIALEGIFPSRN